MENKKDVFSYSYSAEQRREIEEIRSKYLPQEKTKLELLRELDRSVERLASAIALVIGIVGTFILGLGMSCTMVWTEKWFAAGICIGIFGIICVCAAYPVYEYIIKIRRRKLAPQILALTEELTNS